MEELVFAGKVRTQYDFQPMTITAEAVNDDHLVEISSPIDTAHVFKDDVQVCKVTHTSYARSSCYPLTVARSFESYLSCLSLSWDPSSCTQSRITVMSPILSDWTATSQAQHLQVSHCCCSGFSSKGNISGFENDPRCSQLSISLIEYYLLSFHFFILSISRIVY